MICPYFSPTNFLKPRPIYVILILSTLLFTGNSTLFAQSDNIVFERINTSNGLSNNIVRRIFQDSKGYLWIGTADGLNKYDGYNFITYRHDPQDTTRISNNYIWNIFEDKGTNLWIGTEGGLNLYNYETESFKTFKYSTTALTGTQADRFINAVLSIYEDDKQNLWLGTVFKGLTKFDWRKNIYTHYLIDSTGIGNANVVFDIIDDTRHQGKGLFLGCYSSGLCYFDFEKEELKKYKHDPNNSTTLSNDRIWSIFQDGKGDIWIGTEGGGLNMFDADKEEFTHFKHEPQNPLSLSNDNVQSIFRDPDEKDILWIGTRGGLNKFDTQKNSFTV
ncbi:MAG: ligand-binding sensor domain-containing protein [Promethearchaeota archaeon]|jgi:ligand-binding sensor domain-containing protein